MSNKPMTTTQTLSPETRQALDGWVAALRKTLGANLRSLLLYGCAVRGPVRIEPFVLGRAVALYLGF
jgi:hypothetical protein